MAVKAMLDYVKVRYLSRYLGEKGQGIVEYALILAFVIAVAAALFAGGDIRKAVTAIFTDVADKLKSNAPTTTP